MELAEVQIASLANDSRSSEEFVSQSESLLGRKSGIDLKDVTIVKANAKNQHGRTRHSTSNEQITYTWKNICAWTGNLNKVDEKSGKSKWGFLRPKNKLILNNVSGIVRPGELVSILGASGAGKTTLLDLLSFRNRSIKVSGSRVINGSLVESNTITSISAYVQQVDLFFGVLTIREHLLFQSQVRMHRQIPQADRIARVEQVIKEFGLEECADTQIGTHWFKGISGGEMKRLAIATEVLTDPMFMCCDEPTSGLDSMTAQNVMKILKNFASQGKTVLCTIHQPSSQLFALFDKIMLMADGRVAFLGTRAEALEFFNKQGFNCPQMFNPADFWVETLSIKDSENRKIATKICDNFEKCSALSETEIKQGENGECGDFGISIKKPRKQEKSRYKASWFKQFRAVLHRSWISYTRDPVVMPLRFGQNIILALFLGAVYFQLDVETYSGVQNLSGAIFMVLCILTYQHMLVALDTFCSELPVFFREHSNGMYRTDVYFIARVLIEIPFQIILPLIFNLIAHFLVGFYPDIYCFLYTSLIMVLITIICSAVGQFSSCIASSMTMALVIAPLLMFPFFLFGGFLLKPGTGPAFLTWFQDISWYFYGFEALAIVQLENLANITCGFEKYFKYLGKANEHLRSLACPSTGLEVLATLGFEQDNLGRDLIMLGVIALACEAIAFLVLLFRSFRH